MFGSGTSFELRTELGEPVQLVRFGFGSQFKPVQITCRLQTFFATFWLAIKHFKYLLDRCCKVNSSAHWCAYKFTVNCFRNCANEMVEVLPGRDVE